MRSKMIFTSFLIDHSVVNFYSVDTKTPEVICRKDWCWVDRTLVINLKRILNYFRINNIVIIKYCQGTFRLDLQSVTLIACQRILFQKALCVCCPSHRLHKDIEKSST